MKASVAKKAVICVFDGLRPDRVTADLTPNLWRFATGGTWFRESRSVFPSVTRVATTSFATGSKPTTHGIMNNSFYHPEVIGDRLLDTSKAADLRAAEAHHNGRFIEADGLGCALALAGKTYGVVHTGSPGSTYLVNHKAGTNGHWTFSIHGSDHTPTPAINQEIEARFGPLPKGGMPKTAQVDYGADVFVDHVLGQHRPDVALIWFCEPDTSYHYCEIGADDSVNITKRVDTQFGRILDAVARGPDAEETLLVALSDHGHIATSTHVDVHGLLNEAGFSSSSCPGDGLDVVSTLGIALNITLIEKDAGRLNAMAQALMTHDSTGLLFSKSRSSTEGVVPGTLPFSAVGIEHERASDLVCVLRSSIEPDHHGLAGHGGCTAQIDVPLGGGMHGGLNPHELNTVLAFGGTQMPALGTIEDPADLTDIVPTILSLLGVPIPDSMTGLPLPALLGEDRSAATTSTMVAGQGGFEQQLSLSSAGLRPVVMRGDRLR